MIIGTVTLAAGYSPGKGSLLCTGLPAILMNMDAQPNQVTIYSKATFNTPQQVSTTYAISAIGGGSVALGSVLVGTDRSYLPGDLVYLQAVVTGAAGNPGGSTGTIQFNNSGTFGGLAIGANLSVTSGTLNATAGSGSGTVSAGTSNQIAAYPSSGTSVGGLTLVGGNAAISGANLQINTPTEATHAARNSIPNALRTPGMLVFTQNDGFLWQWNGGTAGTDADWVQAGPVQIQLAGTAIANRGAINFIQGANVTLTVADNSGADRCDVTIAASGGGGGSAAPSYVFASGGAAAVNFGTTSDWIVGLSSAASTTITFSGMTAGERGRLILVQDSTGTNLATFSPAISWAGGSAPTLTTAAGKYDMVEVYCPSAGVYLGSVVGQAYTVGGFTLVQVATNTPGVTATATFGSSVTPGNFIVACVTSVPGLTGFSDGEGDYTIDGTGTGSFYPVMIGSRTAVTGGASFTITAAGASNYTMWATEWHPTGTVSVGLTSAGNGVGTSIDPGSISPTGGKGLIVAACSSSDAATFAADSASGFTLGSNVAAGAGIIGLGTQYLTTILAGPVDATLTASASTSWEAAVVEYKTT